MSFDCKVLCANSLASSMIRINREKKNTKAVMVSQRAVIEFFFTSCTVRLFCDESRQNWFCCS